MQDLIRNSKSPPTPMFLSEPSKLIQSIHDLVKEVTSFQPSKIYVTPFMIVAGDHAHNDMAGDSPDSWVCQFENAGFEVCPIIKGLGEYPGIRRMYVEHAQKAIDSMK